VGAQGTHFEKMKSHKLEFEEQRKASKLELEEAVALFNQKPMKGIKLLQKQVILYYESMFTERSLNVS
jgi:hypothetical protein